MILIRTPADLDGLLDHYRGHRVKFSIPKTGFPILLRIVGADDALLDNLVERSIEAWTSKTSE
jgi:type II secretory pathway component PulK